MNKFLILCALALTWACGTHTHTADPHAGHNHGTETACSADQVAADPHAGHDHAAEAKTEAAHGSEIVLTPEQIELLGVKSVAVNRGEFRHPLSTSGLVAPSSGDRAVVAATTDGIVLFANPSLTVGSMVSKGQKLFILSSRALADGDRAARALADYKKAEAAYERAKGLAADQIVSQKELETTQLEFRRAELAYKAFQGSAEERGVAITAPLSGIITSLETTNGSYAAVGAPLASVAQNRRLTLTADVPLTRMEDLNDYTAATFVQSNAALVFDTEQLNGRRTGVNTTVGSGNAYGSISFEVDNRAGMIPGAFAEVVLLGKPRQNVLTIPSLCLIEQEGYYSVVVQLDEECFELRPVTIGNHQGVLTEVLSGLTEGEQVVSHGAHRVKLAGATTAIPDGHNH